jgi:eukaryotic-like serine/threonine-protein kinase
MIGTTVGNYRILERLGRGGMGIVYKALDETLDREVAIKVLNPDLSDADLLKRFRAEAVSLARLNHPGIATIYELRRHDDHELLMVMEFVRGETLQALSERLGPLDPPQAAHICMQILDALSHAHRAGIIHRDLKPANVMLTDSAAVKVMDFGIARMMGAEHFTHAGYMMGTPAYMAPEQVLGQDVDGRADLYSVGVLFYRLLSRELPFQADTAIAMAQKQVADAPTPIGTFRPELPAWCQAMIAKALSKAPADRFQSAEEFRRALRSAVTPASLGELPTMATPTAAGLLRTSDLTLTSPSGPLSAPTVASSVPRTGASQAPGGAVGISAADAVTTLTSGTGATGNSAATGTTGATAGTAATERTGTNVVLGGQHLIALVALLVVLIAGIAVLGFAALRRGGNSVQTAAATPLTPVSQGSAADAQPGSSPAPNPPEALPTEGSTPPAAPPNATPSATPGAPPPALPASASGTAGQLETATRRPKPAPPRAAATAVPAEPPPAAPPAPVVEPPPPPARPELAPITVKDVKVLVKQGNSMRDRDAVLTLAGDHLAVLDKSGKSEILSLPYSSIAKAFYSRSKQPRWKDADGKEARASVDMGKLSFFRGDRNWLILTTSSDPVFIRFEDGVLRAALASVEERAGVKIER